MPNDAKLGLVLGIALVVVIGMIFNRPDAAASATGQQPPETNVKAPLHPTANPILPPAVLEP